MESLVPISPSTYAVTRTEISKIQHIIRVNLQNESATEFDFDRVGVPAGGGLTWAVPTATGEENIKELEGIIVFHKLTRAYWEGLYDAGNAGNPPDCSSADAAVGIGEPGGMCADCANAKWGSDGRGRGQACKLIRLLFMLRKDDVLPIVVAVPPSSVAVTRKYLLRLTARNTPYYGVVTSLGLERTKNRDGIAYSKVNCKQVSMLPAEMERQIYEYAETIKPYLIATRVKPEDYEIHPESDETGEPY